MLVDRNVGRRASCPSVQYRFLCLSALASCSDRAPMSGNEEGIISVDPIVDPLSGRSSTGDSSGIAAGGPFDCRGDSDELIATLACGDAAVIGSHDVSHVNRSTVGLGLTSFGFPLREDVCRPPDLEQILALVSQAAGPQLDDAVLPSLSVSCDSETTRKVGDRQVLSEPLDFHPYGTGLQFKLSPPDALGASVSSFKASGAFGTISRTTSPRGDFASRLNRCRNVVGLATGADPDESTVKVATLVSQVSMLADIAQKPGCEEGRGA